ncbi:MAG: GNAT family N-acetyltransferase [Gammaproteobacteria bacterium]|nr:GNAT family N-acetyltransferase [Gammaproteobacteria bacterium]
MPGYRTESCIVNKPADIEKEWIDLQQHARHSYFQSWGWIETWLDKIVNDLQIIAVKVWLDESLVGLGLFSSRDIKRHFIFRSRAMYLNEYPFDGGNMVIEYNGLLAASKHEGSVYRETVDFLLARYQQYDEFYFGAIPQDLSPLSSKIFYSGNARCLINGQSPTWSVDLLSFSAGIDSYLASLSRNRRGQIRRSIKVYEQDGPLQITEAKSVEQALRYFDQLKVLHTAYWQSKGENGSFANPRWENFHRTLVKRRFDAGEIQLLKVSSHHSEIGYIYSFILEKHVSVIQTGFKSSKDKRLMPGYVAHTVALTYNRSKGMHIYDLMHGEALYKSILCNRKQQLVWFVLQRKRLKFTIENFVIRLVRYFRV